MATRRIFRVWQVSRIFDFFIEFFWKDSGQSFASENPIDFFHSLGVALKNSSKVKKMVRKYKTYMIPTVPKIDGKVSTCTLDIVSPWIWSEIFEFPVF